MGYFDVRLPFDVRRAMVWREVVAYLRPWLLDKRRVMEVGAGYCAFINAVQAPVRVALDISSIIVEHAAEGVQTHVVDLRSEDLQPSAYDAVLASNVFEHFTDEEFEVVIRRIHASLAPGGILVAIQPNFRTSFREYFDDYTHKKIFTDEGLAEALIANGYKIIHREARFLPFSFKSSPSILPIALLQYMIRIYLLLPWRPRAGQMLMVAQKL